MRGTARRARSAIAVDLRAFGWDRSLIATLRHSTLPWFDGFAAEISLDATPIADSGELGARDRLSLVAQFATHEALLQFAGFSDADYDPAEWAIVRKRGNDCRLVRIAARHMADDAPPALTVIQQFAETSGAPLLESLRQPWGRAESVYLEIEARLRGDAAADLRWMRRSACGEIASPGPEALNDILRGSSRSFRGEAIESVRAAAALGGEQLLEIGRDASPLQRYSAINALAVVAGPMEKRSESEIVEAIVERGPRQRTVAYLGQPDWGVMTVTYLGSILMAGGYRGVCSLMSAFTRISERPPVRGAPELVRIGSGVTPDRPTTVLPSVPATQVGAA